MKKKLMAGGRFPANRFHGHIADCQPVPSTTAMEQVDGEVVCLLPVLQRQSLGHIVGLLVAVMPISPPSLTAITRFGSAGTAGLRGAGLNMPTLGGPSAAPDG